MAFPANRQGKGTAMAFRSLWREFRVWGRWRSCPTPGPFSSHAPYQVHTRSSPHSRPCAVQQSLRAKEPNPAAACPSKHLSPSCGALQNGASAQHSRSQPTQDSASSRSRHSLSANHTSLLPCPCHAAPLSPSQSSLLTTTVHGHQLVPAFRNTPLAWKAWKWWTSVPKEGCWGFPISNRGTDPHLVCPLGQLGLQELAPLHFHHTLCTSPSQPTPFPRTRMALASSMALICTNPGWVYREQEPNFTPLAFPLFTVNRSPFHPLGSSLSSLHLQGLPLILGEGCRMPCCISRQHSQIGCCPLVRYPLSCPAKPERSSHGGERNRRFHLIRTSGMLQSAPSDHRAVLVMPLEPATLSASHAALCLMAAEPAPCVLLLILLEPN